MIKAEYVAMIEGLKKAIWLPDLFGELSSSRELIVIYSDRQSAIHLSKNYVS